MEINRSSQSFLNYDHQLVVENRLKKIEECKKRFENLLKDHPAIFLNDAIQEVPDDQKDVSGQDSEETSDVEMCSGVYTTGKFLTASDVFASIIIASKGTKKASEGPSKDEKELVIGLYNFCAEDPEEVLKQIKFDLEERGCSDIEFSLIGGALPYIDNDDTINDWAGDFVECLEAQEKFLSLSNEFNIVAARFNLLNPQEDKNLNIIVTKKKVLYMI